MRNLKRTIEELGANAWPAVVQQQLEGWKLRASDGVSRRANSVYTAGPMPSYDDWMDVVTEFYGRRSLPVRFSVTGASPEGLDGLLDRLGYTVESPSLVQVVACADVLERSEAAPHLETVVSETLDSEWLDLFMRMEAARRDHEATYRRIMSSVGPRQCFARVLADGQTVGVGRAVAERGWSGLYNIAIAETHRRIGVGIQVVRALTEWSAQAGASHLYLQMMKNNEGALALYGKLGYKHIYDYYYRLQS